MGTENGNLDNEKRKWEQTAAAVTKIHSMLKGMDLKHFIQYSELHISSIENRKDVDIKKVIKQKAAVEAFREKAKALRIAKNNMNLAAQEFTKKHGKKKKDEQESDLIT